MSFQDETKRFETLTSRAKKLKLKIEFVIDPMSHRDFFGIGPTNIKNFNTHCDKNEGDNCKVAVLDTLSEVEAFILSREMI